jgi:hypothetical protein
MSDHEHQYAEWFSEQRGIPVDEALAHARRPRPCVRQLGAAMTKPMASEPRGYCSFCGKSQHEVRKLIAGPTVFICDECVETCAGIIRGEPKG